MLASFEAMSVFGHFYASIRAQLNVELTVKI